MSQRDEVELLHASNCFFRILNSLCAPRCPVDSHEGVRTSKIGVHPRTSLLLSPLWVVWDSSSVTTRTFLDQSCSSSHSNEPIHTQCLAILSHASTHQEDSSRSSLRTLRFLLCSPYGLFLSVILMMPSLVVSLSLFLGHSLWLAIGLLHGLCFLFLPLLFLVYVRCSGVSVFINTIATMHDGDEEILSVDVRESPSSLFDIELALMAFHAKKSSLTSRSSFFLPQKWLQHLEERKEGIQFDDVSRLASQGDRLIHSPSTTAIGSPGGTDLVHLFFHRLIADLRFRPQFQFAVSLCILLVGVPLCIGFYVAALPIVPNVASKAEDLGLHRRSYEEVISFFFYFAVCFFFTFFLFPLFYLLFMKI